MLKTLMLDARQSFWEMHISDSLAQANVAASVSVRGFRALRTRSRGLRISLCSALALSIYGQSVTRRTGEHALLACCAGRSGLG